MATDSNKIQDRYCRCILHVAGKSYSGLQKKVNPYAVCTKSIYKGGKRGKMFTCADKYTFEDYETDELRGYAIFKKIQNAENMNRDQLINILYKYVATMKGKEVWQEYLKKFRESHPQLNIKEARKKASEEYNLLKNNLLKQL